MSNTNTSTPRPTGPFTMVDVAQHNSPQSCWSVIKMQVYDLTNWISQHPGGPQRIVAICGKDGTAGFTERHDGQEQPEAQLAAFKIGDLGQ